MGHIIYIQAYMTSSMFVGNFSNTDGYGGVGAERTERALFISNRETTFTVSGSKMEGKRHSLEMVRVFHLSHLVQLVSHIII